MNESRAESFGERPTLTIGDLRKHTETMDKVNELLERNEDVPARLEPDSKEERLESHLGDLQKKLKDLDKDSAPGEQNLGWDKEG